MSLRKDSTRHKIAHMGRKDTELRASSFMPRPGDVFEVAVLHARHQRDFEEQHGPVRVLFKDGKPV